MYLEVLRLGVRFLQQSRQMNVQEGGNVAEVEQANVPQVNRFLVQHRGGNHPPGYEVPCIPDFFPLLPGWDGEWSPSIGCLQLFIACDSQGRSAEEGEHEWRALEKPE